MTFIVFLIWAGGVVASYDAGRGFWSSLTWPCDLGAMLARIATQGKKD